MGGGAPGAGGMPNMAQLQCKSRWPPLPIVWTTIVKDRELWWCFECGPKKKNSPSSAAFVTHTQVALMNFS